MTNIGGSTFRPIGYDTKIGQTLVAQTSDRVENVPEKGLTRYILGTPIEIPNSGRIFKNYLTNVEIIATKNYNIINIYTKKGFIVSCAASKSTDKNGMPKYFVKDYNPFDHQQALDIAGIAFKKINSMDAAKGNIINQVNKAFKDNCICKNSTDKNIAVRRVFKRDDNWQHAYSIILPGSNSLQTGYIMKNDSTVILRLDGPNGKTYNCTASLDYGSYANIGELYSYGIPAKQSEPYQKPLTNEEKTDMINKLIIIRDQAETNEEYKKSINAIIQAITNN